MLSSYMKVGHDVELSYYLTDYQAIKMGEKIFVSPAIGYELLKKTDYDPIKLLDLLKYRMKEEIKKLHTNAKSHLFTHIKYFEDGLELDQTILEFKYLNKNNSIKFKIIPERHKRVES
jgi:hypothetical protein